MMSNLIDNLLFFPERTPRSEGITTRSVLSSMYTVPPGTNAPIRGDYDVMATPC